MRAPRPAVLTAWTLVVALSLGAGVTVQRLWELRAELEELASRLELDAGPESTLLFDANDQPFAALYDEHRMTVPLEGMSRHLIDAVLVTEDRRFFEHRGLDVRRIVSAAVANHRAGEIVQGGSTITQQLVRATLLGREQRFERKFKEAVLARRLEEQSSKADILETYLNRVYLGDGYYGVEAAARGYFGTHAAELTPLESALLAGIIKGPSLYAPTRAPAAAQARRDVVLGLMRDAGLLSAADHAAAVAVPVTAMLGGDGTAIDPRRAGSGHYFRDAVVRDLLARYGRDVLHTEGLRVYTTLDPRAQASAEHEVTTRLRQLPARAGAPLQGALVAIDPHTGHVKAMVGGRDYTESPFNRALDARRQPGSAFKPFVFAMALESGFTPGTALDGLDRPIASVEGPWLPRGEHEGTSLALREALVMSSNRAAAHLLQQVGIRRTLDLVQRFGITSPLPAVPSLALGTGELTLTELTAAYGVFATGGHWRPPTLIRRVVDRHGRELSRAADRAHRVISEATAYLMTSMMSDVIRRGTATRIRTAGFTRAAAGKTGTSQSYADAWFVGYTPHLVTGVWFGYDQPRTIMDRGVAGVVAAPAWARFMATMHEGLPPDRFEMPSSLTTVRICRLSGDRAREDCDQPVIAPLDAAADGAAVNAWRDGDVYEDVRVAALLPPLCHLSHGWQAASARQLVPVAVVPPQ